jgi:4-amino-4-deoxy-L-arabinose transferase-like glycosyltransferase
MRNGPCARLVTAALVDLRGPRFLACGAVVAAVASLATIASYVNQPAVPYDPDSPIYLYVAGQVAQGHFVDRTRTPGYPLFIDLVTHFAGATNLEAISIIQGVLFVLAAVGVYVLAALSARRAWAALLVALPVAANSMLISYVHPIMTEAQALLLLVGLALALVWYIRQLHPRAVWLAMGILFALAITRPEWVYFVVPFAGFLLLVAWSGHVPRRLLPHVGGAFLLFVALCGLYAYGNARHGYFGFGANQNADLLGKVMQYHMQHQAPPQYAAVTREVDAFMARGDYDPWHVIYADPALRRNWYALAADYGRSIMLRHPVEFVTDTIPVVFVSLRASDPHTLLDPHGPFSAPLSLLQLAASAVQSTLLLFPLIALAWWTRLFRPRKVSERALIMGGLSLLCAYPLAISTLFVYTQYARMNAPYDPLMLVVVWLTFILAVQRLAGPVLSRLRLGSFASAPTHDAGPVAESMRGDRAGVPE